MDFGHFATIGAFWYPIRVKFATDEFKVKIKLLGELKEHNAPLENGGVIGITIAISMDSLNMGIGLGEVYILILTRGKIVGAINIAGINHAGSRDGLAAETLVVMVI